MNFYDDIIFFNNENYIIKSVENNLDKRDIFNKSVVDYGCGSGDFIKFILNYKPKSVIGIDIGAKNINYCKSNIFSNYTNLDFKKKDLCLIDFKKKKYDLIWSDTVIEFLETDLEKIINQFSIALNLMGFLFIFTKRSFKNMLFIIYFFLNLYLRID